MEHVTAAPCEREEKELSCPQVSRLHCRPARSPLPSLAADAAMARARRRSRTPAGRTERRSRRGHHPGHRPGKVRADAPCDTRRTGYSPIKKAPFRVTAKRGVRGCRGCRGEFSPLTPCPAPGRRPAARAGQQPQGRGGWRAGRGREAFLRLTKQICCAGDTPRRTSVFLLPERKKFLL